MASSQLQDTLDPYAALHSQFRWLVPDDFNIAQPAVPAGPDKTPHKVAIREHVAGQSASKSSTYSYRQLHQAANQLSNLLTTGVKRGDRVAIVLPQRFETAVAYMAVLQMGAVAMPLSILFGPEALQYRLKTATPCWRWMNVVVEPACVQSSHCARFRVIMAVAGVFIALYCY